MLGVTVAATAMVSPAQTKDTPSYSVLYTFTGGADGGFPQYGRLIADSTDNFYGTATFGGDLDCPSSFGPPNFGPGCGVVFKLDPAGNETVLYTFTGGTDGSQPWTGLTIDPEGNLYGTATFGGVGPGNDGAGVVFKVDQSGQETVLHTFSYTDGANPTGDLVQDSLGSLYGTTVAGGDLTGCHGFGCGVIFWLDSSGELKGLHQLGGLGGANPTHGLARDAAGDLYGTTENGGDLAACSSGEWPEPVLTGAPGCGVIFKLDHAGKETPLYTFNAAPDGSDPRTSLIRDAAGKFYGTTFYGGLYGAGMVFKLDAAGHETVLYNFTGRADGANPWDGMVRDAAGNLYGTTNHAGGSCYCGTVFKLDPSGNFTVLHTFAGADGQYPEAPLLLYKGALYGMTSSGGTLSGGTGGAGTIFKIPLP